MKTRYEEVIYRPTDDRRHMPQVREGKISAEIFAKKPERRIELGLTVFIPDDYVDGS